MADIIKKLRVEHAHMLDLLTRAKSEGIGSEAFRNNLTEVKNLLVKHLELEDMLVYPLLDKAAVNNNKLKKMLDEFKEEMNEIATFAMDFFDRLSHESGAKLQKDFKSFMNILLQRIVMEEKVLYKAYEDMIG